MNIDLINNHLFCMLSMVPEYLRESNPYAGYQEVEVQEVEDVTSTENEHIMFAHIIPGKGSSYVAIETVVPVGRATITGWVPVYDQKQFQSKISETETDISSKLDIHDLECNYKHMEIIDMIGKTPIISSKFTIKEAFLNTRAIYTRIVHRVTPSQYATLMTNNIINKATIKNRKGNLFLIKKKYAIIGNKEVPIGPTKAKMLRNDDAKYHLKEAGIDYSISKQIARSECGNTSYVETLTTEVGSIVLKEANVTPHQIYSGHLYHIIPKIYGKDIKSVLEKYKNLEGEVCASTFGSFSKDGYCTNPYGLLMNAKHVPFYYGDVWSNWDQESGIRYATNYDQDSAHSEVFVSPAKANIIGLFKLDLSRGYAESLVEGTDDYIRKEIYWNRFEEEWYPVYEWVPLFGMDSHGISDLIPNQFNDGWN